MRSSSWWWFAVSFWAVLELAGLDLKAGKVVVYLPMDLAQDMAEAARYRRHTTGMGVSDSKLTINYSCNGLLLFDDEKGIGIGLPMPVTIRFENDHALIEVTDELLEKLESVFFTYKEATRGGNLS